MVGSEILLGIIMAGGRGTRLMPLTANRPKPMVPVLGRPVIDYVKDAMVAAGLSEIIVTTGCLLYTSPSPRDATLSRMPSSA